MKQSVDFCKAPRALPLFILALAFSGTAVFPQNSPARAGDFPRISPDPKAVEFFQRGGQGKDYSWLDLAEISLWASGNTETSRLAQIKNIAETLRTSPELPKGERERAEFILEYMHRNVLKTYSLNQTRVDVIFDNGKYNCVSSAVLYMVLGKSLGLNLSGVMTKDHAFVMVHIDGENIDIETTNILGFDPGNRREFHDNFGRLTGFAYVPAQNYRDRQTINPVKLVSLILQNRIAESETRRRFSEAVPIAVDSLALLSGEVFASGIAASQEDLFENPRLYLLGRLLNFGASLLNAGREEESLRWASYASLMYPDARWQEFVVTAANNRITRLTRQGNVTEAKTFLASHREILSSADYSRFDTILVDMDLAARAGRINSSSDSESVIAAIQDARRTGRIGESRADELLVFSVRRTASLISAAPSRDWLGAISYIENAIYRFGSTSEFEQDLNTYRNNRAADFHNRFAAAWNRRSFDEAERILAEGLSELPNNRQLLADRELFHNQRQ